jgi:hypothetical protein
MSDRQGDGHVGGGLSWSRVSEVVRKQNGLACCAEAIVDTGAESVRRLRWCGEADSLSSKGRGGGRYTGKVAIHLDCSSYVPITLCIFERFYDRKAPRKAVVKGAPKARKAVNSLAPHRERNGGGLVVTVWSFER